MKDQKPKFACKHIVVSFLKSCFKFIAFAQKSAFQTKRTLPATFIPNLNVSKNWKCHYGRDSNNDSKIFLLTKNQWQFCRQLTFWILHSQLWLAK